MFSTLRNRFGIPGVISVIALVFAMIGGAYAANNLGGSGKGATASAKKALKGPRGPRGATGATGAAGPAGAQGPAGPAGPKGDAGAAGANGAAGEKGEKGATGTNGTSVTSTSVGPGPNCNNGGVVFKIGATPAGEACNGAPGAAGEPGPKGDPWTAGGTLPVNATETGTWAFSNSDEDLTEGLGFPAIWTTVSFNVPLASPATTHYIGKLDSVPSECENDAHPGVASVGNPEADSGHFCMYEGIGTFNEAVQFSLFVDPALTGEETGLAGVHALFKVTVADKGVIGHGSWAVTG